MASAVSTSIGLRPSCPSIARSRRTTGARRAQSAKYRSSVVFPLPRGPRSSVAGSSWRGPDRVPTGPGRTAPQPCHDPIPQPTPAASRSPSAPAIRLAHCGALTAVRYSKMLRFPCAGSVLTGQQQSGGRDHDDPAVSARSAPPTPSASASASTAPPAPAASSGTGGGPGGNGIAARTGRSDSSS